MKPRYKLLDGLAVAAEIRKGLKEGIERRKYPALNVVGGLTTPKPPPTLAVVLCSDDPASQIYVKRKQEACHEVGINSFMIKPFEGGLENWSHPKDHLLSTIDWLNKDDSVNGILVQLPLPPELKADEHEFFDRIDPLKDVDVFNPKNVGLLVQGRPRFIPCTPAGIQELLCRNEIQIQGKRVAIINRSDIVGKPLHALLSQNSENANATVTLCHDHTPPKLLKEVCLASDIIIVAVGKQSFLKADMVPEGAVVVDVGINRIGKKVVGDVDFDAVAAKVSAISPVPGGVGPMTVTMLLQNTVLAQTYQLHKEGA